MEPSIATGKVHYGIDAPGVIRYLIFFGIILITLVTVFPLVKFGSVDIDTRGFIWSGLSCVLMGCLMLFYSLKGKIYHRDRMLNLVNWTGNEQVLDVGTGLGLLMVGAAKRLTTGQSTGIDIWNASDLSNNAYENALNNALLEDVADKVHILNEDAMNTSFADESFDVILSNLCLHNIYNKPGRLKACQEIARMLKADGTAVISDFRHMKEYKFNFEQLGLKTKMLSANYLLTFPPLKILVVTKK